MKLSETKIVLIGHGLFEVFFGMRFAEDFKTVYFWNPGSDPGADAFPMPSKRYVGEGIPGIVKVPSYEEIKAEILKDKGIFCFLDVGMADKQWELRQAGARVFGAGGDKDPKEGFVMERLEMDRLFFKKTLARLGLSFPKYQVVYGIDALVTILRKEKRKWVKLNVTERGIRETFFHEEWKTSVTMVDELAHKLGFLRDTCFFMIEDEIPGVEPGGDRFYANGEGFDEGLEGWEEKGCAYLCKVKKASEMSPAIRIINAAMAPLYRKHKLNGAISTEIRVGKDKDPHYIDACQRMGNPPAATISEIYKNISDIVRGIADGEMVKPEFKAKCGAEIGVESASACTESVPFDFDEKKDLHSVKLRLACKIENQFFNIPSNCGATVVKCIGLGKTIEEAEFNCLEAAEKFQCKEKTYEKSSFESLEEKIKEGKKYGVTL